MPVALQPLPSLLLGLARLRLDEAATGAPKRKSAAPAHSGVRYDSSRHSIGAIALSRVLTSRDDALIDAAATSPWGGLVLGALRGVARQAEPRLSEQNVLTLFKASGAVVSHKRSYDVLFGLPDKLPHEEAQQLLSTLLEAIARVRATSVGAAVEAVLLTIGTSASTHTPASAALAVQLFARAVAKEMGVVPPPAPPVAPSPTPTLTPLPEALPDAVTRQPLSSMSSLLENAQRRVETALQRALAADDAAVLAAALDDALVVLSAASGEARRALLTAPIFVALADAAMAQLWASLLDALSADVDSLPRLRSELMSRVGSRAGDAILAALDGIDSGTGSSAVATATTTPTRRVATAE